MSLVKAVQGKEKFYSWAIVICDATTLAFFFEEHVHQVFLVAFLYLKQQRS